MIDRFIMVLCLNLKTVAFNKIEYFYDATGVKQKKVVSTGNTTLYAGNFIYEDNGTVEELKFFNHAEGYVEPDGSSFDYVYQYKDHLGNIRLSYSDANNNGVIEVTSDPLTTEIIEENNYYPFGLKHKGYNTDINGTHHKYMFGGKELQDDVVGNSSFEMYDFGARNYDPALGRWMNPDAMSDSFRSLSPYNYAASNPVLVTDPDGNDISFGFQYEKDEEGNDVIDKNGNRNLIGITMTVTGKVINTSGKKVDMAGAVSEISSQLASSFNGEVNGVKFNTVVNLTEANSMDDVKDSDHVFALAEINTDNVKRIYGDRSTAYGASNQPGGKVAFIDVDYFIGSYDTSIGSKGEITAAHEFGHLTNLGHVGGWKNFFNLMLGNGSPGTKVTEKQLSSILRSYSDKKLNRGVNYEIFAYPTMNGWKQVKKPNRGIAKPLIKY